MHTNKHLRHDSRKKIEKKKKTTRSRYFLDTSKLIVFQLLNIYIKEKRTTKEEKITKKKKKTKL